MAKVTFERVAEMVDDDVSLGTLKNQYTPEEMVGIGDIVPAGPHKGLVKMGNGVFSKGMPADRTNPVK